MELQPFDRNDYMAFAGAVGDNPLIWWAADGLSEDIADYVIVDNEGVCIGFDSAGTYLMDASYELGKRIVKGMDVTDLTAERLTAMGFRRID